MNEETYTFSSKSLGKNIKEARIAAGRKKQSDFAKDCELTSAGLSKIEKGKRNPSIDTILRFCRELGTRPERLLNLPVTAVPEGGPFTGKEALWRDAIGPRLAFCLHHRNLTPHQLGALTGFSHVTITAIANGHTHPSVELLALLSFHLKVPASWLLGVRLFA